jgi:hypothetical protein
MPPDIEHHGMRMKNIVSNWKCHLLLTLSLVAAPWGRTAESEAGFVSMFNGKDLAGWDGKPGWWHVEDGLLTAESTKEKPCDKCNYLIWRGGKPGDFELRADYRLFGAGANSGIQFRSKELPDWDTSGYQADLEAGDQWTGCLFEHTRGGVAMRGEKVSITTDGKKKIVPVADPQKLMARAAWNAENTGKGSRGAELLRAIKKNDWNSYRIIARGPDITLEINGVVMCQATDLQEGVAARSGIIALQMHPGQPMKVQFRNLRIKIYDEAKPGQ